MSDISIPGVSSKYNTDKVIEDLMKLERIPKERMETEVEEYEDTKQAWRDVNKHLSDFRTSAMDMYSFQNPFNERVAESSDEDVITATATREAIEGVSEIEVIQLASADRFVTQSMDKDYRAPEGEYIFTIGEEEIKFNFGGGKLTSLAAKIQDRAGGLLRARVVNDTASTRVMLIEGTETGSNNRIFFGGTAQDMAKETGIIEEKPNNAVTIDVKTTTIQPAESGDSFTVSDDTISVDPGSTIKIPFGKTVNNEGDMIVEYEVRLKELPQDAMPQTPPPPGPSVPGAGELTIDGITIFNESSYFETPEWEPPAPPPRVDDNQALYLGNSSRNAPLPELIPGESFKTVKAPLSEIMNNPSFMEIRNNNTHRQLEIKNIRVYDPLARGDYITTGAIGNARDAVVKLDGIRVQRTDNVIDDLLPGVTLTLEGVSDKPINLDVKPDADYIKEKVIEFVANYNRLVSEIQIMTRDDPAIIEEIEYFSEDERDEAKEQMNIFSGDMALSQLQRSLQTILMNAYPTSDPNTNVLMAQFGVSTDSRPPGSSGSIDMARLRGYLEIDEEKLDQAIKTNLQDMKEVFGIDTDGDLVIDTGVGFELQRRITPYTQIGGIIATRLSSIDTQIKRKQDDIDEYDDYLVRYEQDLKRKYGMMEGALENLNSNSSAIENFSRQNSGN